MRKACGLTVKCDFDGHQYNLRDLRRRLLQKPWRVAAMLARLQEPLSKRCSNRRGATSNREHGECRGRDAQESARYSEKLADAIGRTITGGPNEGILCVAAWKMPAQPSEPTEAERRTHEATHLPFAPWRRCCVEAKATDAPHRTLAEPDEQAEEVPVVELDYGHAWTNDVTNGVKDSLVALAVAVLKLVGYTFASVCRCKGAADSIGGRDRAVQLPGRGRMHRDAPVAHRPGAGCGSAGTSCRCAA